MLNYCYKKMQSFLKQAKIDNSISTPDNNWQSNKLKEKLVPWVEKYRPRTVEDIVEQNEVVSVLRKCISGEDLPNLLFYGPPGTGKTSTILATVFQLFGDYYKNRVLELNASDERGIQIIRDKVKSFSQLSASNILPNGKVCPSFKFVILDEADSMTHAAQTALRRTIEKETKTTRFCLICNYVSRIIEPITSRCTKFRFKPLNEFMIFERLKFICTEENVNCDDKTLNTLVQTSGGDMRKAITYLQSCAKLAADSNLVNIDNVLEVTGVIPDHWLTDFLRVCKTADYKKLQVFVSSMSMESYPASQVLEQLNDLLITSNEFNNKQKALIGEKLGVVSFRLQDGGSEYVQMLDLGYGLIKIFNLE